MLAQSAVHESGGRSPAAESLAGSLPGSENKGKKPKGLAGLFSDILSQAQKNLGAKDAKALKASCFAEGVHATKSSSHEAEARRIQASRKDAQHSSDASLTKLAPSNKLGVSIKLSSSKTGVNSLITKGRETSGTKSAGEKDIKRDASETPVQLHGTHGTEAEQAEVLATADQKSKAAEDKRRPKSKSEAQADASALALVNFKALSPNATPAKAKTGEPSIDVDSSINSEGGRKGDHPSSKPDLTVIDLRRQNDAKKVRSGKEATGGEASFAEPTKAALREGTPAPDSSNAQFRELTFDARGTGESGSLTQARSDAEVASGRGQDFQSMLSERLHDQWNGEIVQSAHIVLRDGDTGTIRLRLRPESLGNVKIELNLSDNNISGKIVVESDEAKSAFEKNMNDLADAFKQGGFDSAKLEVAVGSGSGGGTQAQGGRSEGSADPFFSERLRSTVSSPADPATAASAYSRRGSSVDMFA
jgi:flagellar hook-length control protein FliK